MNNYASLLPLFYRVSVFSGFLWLSACATAPQQTLPTTSKATTNEALTHWKAEGKIGFRSDSKSQSANFVWENSDQSYKIQLFGPFGQGRVIIEKIGNSVELLHDGKSYRADSAQALLKQATDLSMPVHWLSYWIKGVPAANVALEDIQLSDAQQLEAFRQENWKVTYTRFENVNAFTVPSKMTFEEGNYRLTAVVKAWQIPAQ